MRYLLLILSLLWPIASDAGLRDRLHARSVSVQPVTEISYGRDPLQKLDLYLPAQRSARAIPLVAFIHGGGWTMGDKREGAHQKPQAFTRAGYAFASLNYRLAPKASIADMQADLATAVARLRILASRYGYDPDRIILSGHSAGAHLAALLATDTRYA
jgi:arylformamidase